MKYFFNDLKFYEHFMTQGSIRLNYKPILILLERRIECWENKQAYVFRFSSMVGRIDWILSLFDDPF